MTAPEQPSAAFRTLARIGRLIRATWLIAGVVLLLAFGVEFGYRWLGPRSAQQALDPNFASVSIEGPLSPYHDQPWFKDYRREFAASYRMEWQPYVYFRRFPYAGKLITVDSAGRRAWAGATPPGAKRHVWVLGGSAAWGTWHRDSLTLSSVIAESLKARGLNDVAVDNLAETGWVSMQEVVYLELQLRALQPPAAVVFYDGLNDVASAVIAGRAGLPQNESNRESDFHLGRMMQQSDARAVRTLTRLFVARSRVLSALLARRPSAGGRARPAPDIGDTLAADVATTYAATAKVVEALGRSYNFQPIYAWQSSLHATGKKLSPFEQAIVRSMANDRGYAQRQSVHQHMEAHLAAAMAPVAGDRFINLRQVFDGDTGTVFLDQIGHTTEAANQRIAGALMPRIVQALAGRR